MITNHYWYVPEALTPQQCDDIQRRGDSIQEDSGFHFGEDPSQRNSRIAWIYDDEPSETICAWMRQANKEAGWYYDLEIPEAIQYTKYSPGEYYDWHIDGNSDQHAARRLMKEIAPPIPLNMTPFPQFQGTVRKLSATVNLSDPQDYTGGELQLRCYDQMHLFNDCPRGSIVVFPSFIEHRVSPVESGERCSAVVWYNGYPFR
jgi:PKHD-type hydroxylase|tara:strand:+ start:8905 stop:9513 length:609 start_codon:yes stop_codon:yes gene_type:complete